MILEEIDLQIRQKFIYSIIDEMYINFPILKTLGWGYCALASIYLYRKLKANKINCTMLHGILADEKIYNNMVDILKSYHGTDKTFNDLIQKINIDKPFSKQKKLGHVVVLIDSTIYDIAGVQFKFPLSYSLSLFNKHFSNVKEFKDTNYPTQKIIEELQGKYSIIRGISNAK